MESLYREENEKQTQTFLEGYCLRFDIAPIPTLNSKIYAASF